MEFLPSAQSSSQNESFVSTSKNFLKKQKLNFPVVGYFTWKLALSQIFVNHCLWKQFLDFNSPRTTSSLICLTIFVSLRPLTQF